MDIDIAKVNALRKHLEKISAEVSRINSLIYATKLPKVVRRELYDAMKELYEDYDELTDDFREGFGKIEEYLCSIEERKK